MGRFLILDGYPKEEREKFDHVGMTRAGELYKKMLSRYVDNNEAEILYTSDDEQGVEPDYISQFDAVLWPGCSLCIYKDDWRAKKMANIARVGFEKGVPQFGSCWAAQVAVYVVGGKVSPHREGREIGISRRIQLNQLGSDHPMYAGKPTVFEAFTSHDDFIESIPEQFLGPLSSNDWCDCQSVCIKYKNGEFWAPQYHPEYNFYEMGKLILARQEKLLKQEFFSSREELEEVAQDFIHIHENPTKHLLWKYGVGEGILNSEKRELEFFNWLRTFFPNLLK